MKYEYKVIEVFEDINNQNEIQNKCDKMGEDGWELVNFQSYILFGTTSGFVLIFKREKKEEK